MVLEVYYEMVIFNGIRSLLWNGDFSMILEVYLWNGDF